MPASKHRLPAFTLALSSDANSVLIDYQRASSRQVQVPVFGPRNDDLLNVQTPISFIDYQVNYPSDQDSVTAFEDGTAENEINHGFFRRCLKTIFSGFGQN